MSDARKIKLIQIIADSNLGGGAKHVLGILKYVNKAEFQCHLICPKGYLSREAERIKGVKVHLFQFGAKFSPSSIMSLKRLINEIRVEDDPFGPLIIHTHGSKAAISASTMMVAGAHYVYTEHLFSGETHLDSRISEWVQKKALKRINNHIDLVVAVSPAVKKFLVQHKLAPEKRTIVIPNGIDPIIHRAAPETKLPEIVIGTVGNLHRLKGQKYLIEAVTHLKKEFPNIKLEIIGDGPEKEYLKKLVSGLDLQSNVRLLGVKENIEEFLSTWSVFVLPSLAETFGIAILEAWVGGVPVVATKVGGVANLIEDGVNGFLVKPRDSKGLAHQIKRILSEKDSRNRIVDGGRQRAVDFQWPKVVQRLEDCYKQIV